VPGESTEKTPQNLCGFRILREAPDKGRYWWLENFIAANLPLTGSSAKRFLK
jgi:hypothetical protein